MIYLNEDAIKYAISICKSKQNYKVGIVINTIKIDYVKSILLDLLKDEDCHIRRNGGNFIQVQFNNGSLIRSIPASNNARGFRVHLLIIDDDVDRNIVNVVFKPLQIDYDIMYRETANAVTGFTADRIFFDEFVITFPDEDVDENETAYIDEDEFMKILEATA
jgi:hypothetical protein